MRVDRQYDVEPIELVGVLTDPEFLTAKSARYGGVGAPRVERSASTTVVRSTRQLPLEHVPGPFRRFVGTGRVEQVETWSAPTAQGVTATWTLDTGRAPIRVHGGHEIRPAGAGCHHTVIAEVAVTLPVVAGRLTRQVTEYLAELIRAEQAFAADWLAGMMSAREGAAND